MTVTYFCHGSFSQKVILKCLWQGLNARNVSLQTLCGGQFTLSTQLIRPNYLKISLNDKVEAFLVQNLPWEVQLSTSSMRTTLTLQNSVRIQHPAKFNFVLNELVMEIMLSYHRLTHNSKVSSKREFTVCTVYWDIVENTRTSNEEPSFVWWPTFIKKDDNDLETFLFHTYLR